MLKPMWLSCLLLLCGICTVLNADVAIAQESNPLLHPLFSDNMVLQREIAAPIWGWAKPGESVTVTFEGKSATGKADAEGKWRVKLGPFNAGGPYEMTASTPSKTVALKNILVGDVWICSGQSNMEMGIGNVKNAQQEIASSENNNIRLFSVPKKVALQPQETLVSHWDVCNPKTIAFGGWNGFSAVGYFFGRELEKNLHVPIGLIHTSWGGTIAEAWTSASALEKMEDFKKPVQSIREMAGGDQTKGGSLVEKMTSWYAKNDPGTAASYEKSSTDSSSWKTMKLPTAWEEAGLPNFDGIVWFKKTVNISSSLAKKAAVLHLGPIDDQDATWVNGVKVGATEVFNSDRAYAIPAGLLKEGENVISIRVLDTGGAGGLYGKPEQLKLAVEGETIALDGDWKYKDTANLTKTSPMPFTVNDNPNVVTVLYNGMIAPIVPFGVKGAIWYQGESNAGRAYQYRTLLPTMIQDWRSRFGVGAFPFFIVQLANYQARQTVPSDDGWAELREAQLMTADTVRNSGIAVTTDIGDAADIHPTNKQEVGRRLGLNALALTYHNKVEYSGPTYVGMTSKDGQVKLKFKHADGGLVAQGDKLEGFAIAGEDNKFHWADAKISGDSVLLTSSEVKNPTSVRYAWHINPIGNLYNKAGLPASPFRTDHLPGLTINNH